MSCMAATKSLRLASEASGILFVASAQVKQAPEMSSSCFAGGKAKPRHTVDIARDFLSKSNEFHSNVSPHAQAHEALFCAF
mmetsp:Transcript_14608/g.27416  ORF Transcript_14608/g.27416 Transcript_14608/m.27416 type:complete len:81 (-) Transcript_14608:1097-1339(-)